MEPTLTLGNQTVFSYGMTKFERAIQSQFSGQRYEDSDYENEDDDGDTDEPQNA